MFKAIEKAIINSEVGITPENNGEVIRLSIPPLTEDRRRALVRQCKGEAETAKVSVRNARRDAIDGLKKAVKQGMSEDVEKDAEAQVQKIHDKYLKKSTHLRCEGKRNPHSVIIAIIDIASAPVMAAMTGGAAVLYVTHFKAGVFCLCVELCRQINLSCFSGHFELSYCKL